MLGSYRDRSRETFIALRATRTAVRLVREIIHKPTEALEEVKVKPQAFVKPQVLETDLDVEESKSPVTAPRTHPMRRDWVLFAFLIAVVGGERFAVVRLYRWSWPLPADYALGVLLLAGAVTSALVTKLPGWLLGLYGVIGLCSFYRGEITTRDFRFGIGEPGALTKHILKWSCALLIAWLACRSTVLLRGKKQTGQSEFP